MYAVLLKKYKVIQSICNSIINKQFKFDTC